MDKNILEPKGSIQYYFVFLGVLKPFVMKKQILTITLILAYLVAFSQRGTYTNPSDIGKIDLNKINEGFVICPRILNDGNNVWDIDPCNHSLRFDGSKIYINGGVYGRSTYELNGSIEFNPEIIIFPVFDIDTGEKGVINIILNNLKYPVRIEVNSKESRLGYYYSLLNETNNNVNGNSEEINHKANSTQSDTLDLIYQNHKFNFCFHYPSKYFKQIIELKNGAGAVFISDEIQVSVYAYYNININAFDSLYLETYKSLIHGNGQIQEYNSTNNTFWFVGLGGDGLTTIESAINEGVKFSVIKIRILKPLDYNDLNPQDKKLINLCSRLVVWFDSCDDY